MYIALDNRLQLKVAKWVGNAVTAQCHGELKSLKL